MVVSIDALGAGSDYSGLAATVFSVQGSVDSMGAPVPPGLDWSKYVWHPRNAQQAGFAYLDSYVSNQTWVGLQGDVSVFVSFSGFELPLPLHHASLAMTFSADHATTTNGNIGGVIATEDLVAAVKAIAGKVSSSLCVGTSLDGVLQQIRQGSDIMHDGTQDPTKVCDAVSIGLGFETRASQLGAPAPPTFPVDPCAGM
jgi:hypothetical protein